MPASYYRFGLTGYPLGHSLSPLLHRAALSSFHLEGEYQLFPVAPDDPEGLAALLRSLRQGTLQGLNITIPHKQTVIPLLDELSSTAESIGAVNTVLLKENRLIGDNTDAPGFWTDIRVSLSSSQAPLPWPVSQGGKGEGRRRGVVLGAGGAARAVVYALLTHGWDVTLAVRRADVGQAKDLIDSFQNIRADADLDSILLEKDPMAAKMGGVQWIINATPLGMSPEVDQCPWPDDLPFPDGAFVYDVVYNPRETVLVRRARAAGLAAVTGLGMLVEQAALSFKIWTGHAPDRNVMLSAVEV